MEKDRSKGADAPRMPAIHRVIACGFGSGYSPVAPGTAGSLLALLAWWVCALLLDEARSLFFCTLAFVVVFTVLGVWSAGIAEKYWGKDPSRVVIDEMVGMWIALLAAGGHREWGYMAAAFLLFRFFDIVKPFGIRKMEKLPSGYGVMADDILSGIYSLIILCAFRLAGD